MDDLVAFRNARYDEDEQVAKAATAGPWSVDDERHTETIYSADHTAVVAGGRWGGEAPAFETTEDAIHIARHDPARELAEVEAKRPLVEFWSRAFGRGGDFPGVDWDRVRSAAQWTLKQLALPYSAHPDYRDEWRP